MAHTAVFRPCALKLFRAHLKYSPPTTTQKNGGVVFTKLLSVKVLGSLASATVSLGWDPSARPEADELRYDEKIFHQKNTFSASSRNFSAEKYPCDTKLSPRKIL